MRVGALVFGLLVLGLGSWARASERAGLEVRAVAGLGGRFREGWVPVTVRIETASGFDGELVVETDRGDQHLNWRRARCPVSVRRGAPAEYTLYLYLRPLTGGKSAVHAYLTRGGRAVTRRFAAPLTPVQPDDILVCSISAKGAILGGAPTPRPAYSTTYGASSGTEKRYVVVSDLNWQQRKNVPANVPDRWVGYAGADVVVLYEADFSKMHAGEAKARALYEWVKQGGTVVLAASSGAWFDRPFVQSLCPSRRARRTRSTHEAVLSEIERLGGKIEFRRRDTIATCARTAPGAKAVSDADGTALWYVPSALGRAVFVGVDLANPDVRSWSGQRVFWEKLTAAADLVPRRPTSNQSGLVAEAYGALSKATKPLDLSRERLPTVYVMLVLVLTYLVLVGPLNYVLLKRLKIRILLVATIPTVALTFVALNFIVGYSAHGFGTAGRRVSVTVVLPGTGRGGAPVLGRTTTCVSFLPAAKTTARLAGDRYSVPERVLQEGPNLSGQPLLRRSMVKTLERDGLLAIDDIPLAMWEMVYYRSESVRPVGGPGEGLTLEKLSGGRLLLKNRAGGLALRDAFCMNEYGRVMAKIGDVAPGASRNFADPRAASGGGSRRSAPGLGRLPEVLARGEIGRGEFLRDAAELVHTMVWGKPPGWFAWPHRRGLAGTVAVVARLEAPLEEIRLGGRSPREGELDLVVIPLSETPR